LRIANPEHAPHFQIKMIQVLRADITTLDVDAIVNAANEQLAPGGGVCGAIYRAAGPRLVEATKRIGGCKTGEAVITSGFDLPARFIVHAVGPVWSGGNAGEAALLSSAYWNAMDVARQNGVKSIALPAISTGIYGYPNEEAARIAVESMRQQESSFDLIIACVFDEETEKLYKQALEATEELAAELKKSQGQTVSLRILRPLEPSSFEIAMMAKLKTMVSEKMFEEVQRSRHHASVIISFPDPEVQKIWDAIREDQRRVVQEAIENGTYPRDR
jgi:O-acetyl-ADP-ribose deacetylase (regulator of RNase III)